FGLFTDAKPGYSFILEDASYPAFAAWFAEGIKPGPLRLGSLWRAFKELWGWARGWTTGSVGIAFSDLIGNDLSQKTAVLLCMGLDHANGVMSLDANGHLDVTWPVSANETLYDGIVEAGRKFQ